MNVTVAGTPLDRLCPCKPVCLSPFHTPQPSQNQNGVKTPKEPHAHDDPKISSWRKTLSFHCCGRSVVFHLVYPKIGVSWPKVNVYIFVGEELRKSLGARAAMGSLRGVARSIIAMVRSRLVELDSGRDDSELELSFLQVLYESVYSVHGLATSLATSAIPLITHLLSYSCFKSVKMFVPVCCLRH